MQAHVLPISGNGKEISRFRILQRQKLKKNAMFSLPDELVLEISNKKIWFGFRFGVRFFA